MSLVVNTMNTETNRSTAVREEIEALRHMTVGQLKGKYRDVSGGSVANAGRGGVVIGHASALSFMPQYRKHARRTGVVKKCVRGFRPWHDGDSV